MNTSEFYVSLPSTGDSENNPKNAQSHYVTYVNPPIFLDGDWKCGLSEISFSNDFQHKFGRVQVTINQHYKFLKLGDNIDKNIEMDKNNVKFPFVFDLEFFAQPKSNLIQSLVDGLNKLKLLMFNHYLHTQVKYNGMDISFFKTINLDFDEYLEHPEVPNEDKKIYENLKLIKEKFKNDLIIFNIEDIILDNLKTKNKFNLIIQDGFKDKISFQFFGPIVNLFDVKNSEQILSVKSDIILKEEKSLGDLINNEFVNIYSDIIDEQYFGNNKFRILRTLIPKTDKTRNFC